MKITYLHIYDGIPRYVGEGDPNRAYATSRGSLYGDFYHKHQGEHKCVLITSTHGDKTAAVLQEQGLINWLGLRIKNEGPLLNSLSYSGRHSASGGWSDELKDLHHKIVVCPHCGATGEHRMILRYHFDNCGKKETVTCPHCGKVGETRAMYRWHFDHCPENPEAIPRKQTKNNPTVECPHCDKTGGKAQMHRYHFDNCKHKP